MWCHECGVHVQYMYIYTLYIHVLVKLHLLYRGVTLSTCTYTHVLTYMFSHVSSYPPYFGRGMKKNNTSYSVSLFYLIYNVHDVHVMNCSNRYHVQCALELKCCSNTHQDMYIVHVHKHVFSALQQLTSHVRSHSWFC